MLNKIQVLMALVFCLVSFTAFADEFTLTSPTIAPGGFMGDEQVYSGFGCTGQNRSPALQWSAGPEGTRSYAVTVYDPDAPTGSGWWHWLVYNIPADATGLPAGAGNVDGKQLPSGAVQGRTDFGTHAFGGPCPPEGHSPHRYVFTVFALKTEKIEVPADASAAMIGFMINANTLDKASFTAMYGR